MISINYSIPDEINCNGHVTRMIREIHIYGDYIFLYLNFILKENKGQI